MQALQQVVQFAQGLLPNRRVRADSPPPQPHLLNAEGRPKSQLRVAVEQLAADPTNEDHLAVLDLLLADPAVVDRPEPTLFPSGVNDPDATRLKLHSPHLYIHQQNQPQHGVDIVETLRVTTLQWALLQGPMDVVRQPELQTQFMLRYFRSSALSFIATSIQPGHHHQRPQLQPNIRRPTALAIIPRLPLPIIQKLVESRCCAARVNSRIADLPDTLLGAVTRLRCAATGELFSELEDLAETFCVDEHWDDVEGDSGEDDEEPYRSGRGGLVINSFNGKLKHKPQRIKRVFKLLRPLTELLVANAAPAPDWGWSPLAEACRARDLELFRLLWTKIATCDAAQKAVWFQPALCARASLPGAGGPRMSRSVWGFLNDNRSFNMLDPIILEMLRTVTASRVQYQIPRDDAAVAGSATVVHRAVAVGDTDLLTAMIVDCNVPRAQATMGAFYTGVYWHDTKHGEVVLPLHLAAAMGHLEMCKLLVEECRAQVMSSHLKLARENFTDEGKAVVAYLKTKQQEQEQEQE